jgi:Spy/CpxP family protein refolding chaperone
MKATGKYFLPVLAGSLVFLNGVSVCAASLRLQDPTQETSQALPTQDPISRLNLSPQQLQEIRAIREENKDERLAITRRLRESNLALEQALDADNPNEGEVEQRLTDLAAAQAASTRMRVFTELRIRRVLTRQQIAMWRFIRQEAAGGRRPEGQPRRRNVDGIRPNQRNGMVPLFPRPNQPPQTPRP